jgi:hypothetical protein
MFLNCSIWDWLMDWAVVIAGKARMVAKRSFLRVTVNPGGIKSVEAELV